MGTRIWLLLLSMALGACATSTTPQGRMQLTVPAPISAVHSEADMRLRLAADMDIDPCVGLECRLNHAFDQRVMRLGTRLAQSSFAAYPDLVDRIDRFDILVAEKAEPGSASSAAGTIVIFRGVQKLHLGEEALAFLIAREMGHIIARHHDENSSARILFSVLAQLLFPFANLANGSAALVQSTSTSAVTAAASTAASFVGSKLMIASYKESQLKESDAIAMDLLARQGWPEDEIVDALKSNTPVAGENKWSEDLRISTGRIVGIAEN